MLELEITVDEVFNEETYEFVSIKAKTLKLEHSLISISKWEAIWHKPYLVKREQTYEEQISYIKCMTINNVEDEVYNNLSTSDFKRISEYIEDPMTATTFSDKSRGRGSEVVTSELIYYWMISFEIPSEFERWHLNRLMTLIRICNIKNQPSKKMGTKELMSRNAAINAARRKQHHTRG